MSPISSSLCYLPPKAVISSALAAGPAAVLLGTAKNFAILTETGVSTVPGSSVTGNVGVSPITAAALTGFSLVEDISGQFWTSTQINGRAMGASDAVPTPAILSAAVSDMQTAYTDAMSKPMPDFVNLNAGTIGGLILVPGLYKWTTGVTISADITIAGGASDTWIFQISGTLAQAANVHINLIGGAVSQNIIWVVADTVSVGATAVFQGNILAKTNVVIETKAIDGGCIYAQTELALGMATVLCSGAVLSATCNTTSAAPCYTVAFENLDDSIVADDYLGFILTDTVEGLSLR
ncbi:ice-binding protein [Mycena metata]|uniref:Ice-binding protein n=1 Tax=Mycena metata TaxID=1033252 RepID=A0AAD7NAB1_9AGAR|nr:ice-binding protein [Mycena metata]